MILCIDAVLNEDALAGLRRVAEAGRFEDGRRTAGWHGRLVKNNDQLASGNAEGDAARTGVADALARNPTFRAAVLPRRILPPLISRYESTQSYGTHVDDALMGAEAERLRSDVSVTVFLSAPEEYEGGGLVIESTAGEDVYKLPAGAAVVYPSGALHRVEPVSRGCRLAAVTWVQSLVRRADRREILFDLDQTRRALFADGGKTAAFDRLSKCYSNLLRMWAEP